MTYLTLYYGAQAEGFRDYDGVLQYYDLFLQQYDTNLDRRESQAEFTDSSTE